MKVIQTAPGEVAITDARIRQGVGYEQYIISADFVFKGITRTINIRTTDTELFERASENPNHSKIIMQVAGSIISDAIEDYVEEL